MSVALYAEFTARPGQDAEVARRLAALGSAVRAEPGNRQFRAHRRGDMPARFFVYEVYADRDAFEEHLRAPHSREFNEALGPLIVEPAAVLTMLTTVDSASPT